MVTDEIEIKRIGDTDAVLLAQVAVRAYSDHYLHLWFDGGNWYIEKSFSLQNLIRELEDENAWFFLVYLGHEPVGFIKLNINAPFRDESDALELERIYLMNEATGKGIGTYLVKFVFDVAKKSNKNTVWLKVMDSSAEAINFYKNLGFEICGVNHLDFATMKPEYRGMYVMKKAV